MKHKYQKIIKGWEKKLFGYNNRGIVTFSEGCGLVKEQFAVCHNCGQSVRGKKAKDWMFGHIECPKPNGEYLKNDVTPKKIRNVISQLLEKQRKADMALIEEAISIMQEAVKGK